MQDRVWERERKQFDFLQTSLMARRRSWKTKRTNRKEYRAREGIGETNLAEV
jgi:hypothetical protein